MSAQRLRRPGLTLSLLLLAAAAWGAVLAVRGWDGSAGHATLRRGSGPITETLDPQLVISNNDGVIVGDLFEGLVTAGPGGELLPGVAERWEVLDDGLRWRFHLRSSAHWSNGDRVTARDFVFAWRRLVDPHTAAPYASFLEPVENAGAIVAGRLPPSALGVQAVDDGVLEVRLTQPTPYFLRQLRHYATYPVHAATLAAYGVRWTRPAHFVGNGAYALAGWTPGGDVTLRRNPKFHAASTVRWSQVNYVPQEDPSGEAMMFRSGALDTTWELPAAMVQRLREQEPQALRLDPMLGTFFLALNLEREGLRDVRVRHALSMAVDREALVRHVTRSGEQAATRWIPPATPGVLPAAPAWESLPIAARRAQARRLLAEAGFGPGGRPLEVELVYDMGSVHREVGVSVADMWAQVGVKTRLVNVERRVLSALRTERRFGALRAGWTADYADAHSFLEIWLSGAGGLNQSRYRNPAYDRLVAASLAAPAAAERMALVQQAERQLLADMPLIPLYFFARRSLVRPSVCGWVHDPVLDPATRWLSPPDARGRCPVPSEPS